jgi:hypothetical protein
MADNTLAVKITADIIDLQTKFAVAKAEVGGLTSAMNQLAKASAAGIIDPAGSARLQQLAGDMLAAKGRAGEFAAKLNEAGISVGGFGSRAKEEAEGVGGAFESMSGKVNTALQFTGIGIAVEGLRKVAEAITDASERANQIRSMSEVIGVTTTQFQAMQIASEEAGVSSEQLFRAEEKLTTLLFGARSGIGADVDKLKELGLTTDQIKDKTFGTAQMMAYLSGRLNDPLTAGLQMQDMLKVLGGRAGLAAAAIKELGSNLDAWNALVAANNGRTDEQLAKMHETGAWWATLGRQIRGSGDDLLTWGSTVVPGATTAMGTLFPGLLTLTKHFTNLTDAAMEAGKAVAAGASASVHGTIDRSGQDQAAANAAAASAAAATITKDTLDSIKDQIEATKQGSAERLALVREFYNDSLAYYGGNASVDKVKEAHRQLIAEERAHGEEMKREAEKAASELVATTREQAAAIMAETDVSKAEQLTAVRDLYAQELQSAVLTKDKRLEVQRSLDEANTAINREASSTAQAIARQDADTDIAIAKLTLAAKKSVLEQELSANQISAAQKLQIMRQLAAQEFALDLEELDSRLKTLVNQPAEYDRVYNQIRELKAKLTLDMVGYDRQYQADLAKQLKEQSALWKTSVGEIESVEGTLVSDIVGRRKTMSQSLQQIGADLVTKEISNDIKAYTTKLLLDNQTKALEQGGYLYHLLFAQQKAAATVTSEATQTTATVAGDSARLSAQASAALASKAISKTTGQSTVLADAAKAYSGTYASVAQIPYIGWALAPVAAATAYTAVAAYEGLASLDTGTNYVPRDMVAQLHQGEAITPKAYNPAASGGGAAAGGGSAVHNHNYGDVHMSDTNMKRLLASRAGQRMVFDGIASAYRRGAR